MSSHAMPELSRSRSHPKLSNTPSLLIVKILRAKLLGVVFAVSVFGVQALSGETEPVVLHAEPPATTPLARIFPTTVQVQVQVERDGAVAAATILTPRPFVAELTREAACKWRFAASTQEGARSYVLTFVFGGVSYTEEPSHWRVTRQSALAVRVDYYQTTVRRLDRDDQGEIAKRTCPRHQTAMQVTLGNL
jgi:hypothetical protein